MLRRRSPATPSNCNSDSDMDVDVDMDMAGARNPGGGLRKMLLTRRRRSSDPLAVSRPPPECSALPLEFLLRSIS